MAQLLDLPAELLIKIAALCHPPFIHILSDQRTHIARGPTVFPVVLEAETKSGARTILALGSTCRRLDFVARRVLRDLYENGTVPLKYSYSRYHEPPFTVIMYRHQFSAFLASFNTLEVDIPLFFSEYAHRREEVFSVKRLTLSVTRTGNSWKMKSVKLDTLIAASEFLEDLNEIERLMVEACVRRVGKVLMELRNNPCRGYVWLCNLLDYLEGEWLYLDYGYRYKGWWREYGYKYEGVWRWYVVQGDDLFEWGWAHR